jgi:hypothetical protein
MILILVLPRGFLGRSDLGGSREMRTLPFIYVGIGMGLFGSFTYLIGANVGETRGREEVSQEISNQVDDIFDTAYSSLFEAGSNFSDSDYRKEHGFDMSRSRMIDSVHADDVCDRGLVSAAYELGKYDGARNVAYQLEDAFDLEEEEEDE